MILGLSGKKGSGKDLTAKIIQFLTCGIDYNKNRFEEALLYWEDGLQGKKRWDSVWQTKSFASKLKQIVCLLTGCTIEQLEDREFKESYLPEEWNRAVPFPFPSRGFKIVGTTYRDLMKLLGKEVGRNINRDVWVNSLMKEYIKAWTQEHKDIGTITEIFNPILDKGREHLYPYPNWIITDCRFLNEVKAIEDRDGVIIRINRPSIPSTDTHESEVALDLYPFKYILENDSSIDSLISKVKDLLIELKIIQ